jgi:cell division protein FtsI/penicillin-binding protein 2
MYETRVSRVFGFFATGMALLCVRAFTLQVANRENVIEAHQQRVRGRVVLVPHRGDVLWADGTPAATDVPGWRVEIDPRAFQARRVRCSRCGAVAVPRREPACCAECGNDVGLMPLPQPDLGALARLLGVAEDELRSGFERAIGEHARRPEYRWHLLVDGIAREKALELALAGDRFPGVVAHAKLVRETDAAASPVVGSIGPAWDKERDELTDPERDRVYSVAEVYAMRFGRRGLEAAFDESLRGDTGITTRRPRRADGTAREPEVKIPVKDGVPLRTTLRREVQALAEEVVAATDGAAAAVVVDVRDGAVVAISSRSKDGLNHAVASIRPGSVFKLVTALALLEAGVTPDETVNCAGHGPLPSGAKYKCDAVHGSMSFNEAFADSCNAYFATMAERVGPAAMERAARELGFDENPTMHLPGSPPLFHSAWGGGARWWPDDMRHVGLGQGKALASPLQVAIAYARIASGGRRLTPYLVDVERPAEAETDASLARWAPQLRDAARRVVTAGTARGVPALDALEAAGKSGTGDLDTAGTKNNAWFVAFAPASAPRYAAAVVYEGVGGHGAGTAGPSVARLLAEALR